MAVVTCPHCGHQNPLTSNFCSSCGADLDHGSEHGTTMSVTVPIDSPAEEIEIELDELPPGVGMLVVTRGPNSGSRFALDQALVTAGRHPDSVIFLDDITVSRRHAEVRQVSGGYVVADVGSLNGTYLNRERVEESPLHDGDELQIGTFKLLFLAGRR
ncbi:MAG: FHA domain-containing protein [Acidimicrobiales bacterium]|nr:FHA domain-containing protein [Acidimicrobiales bacterium]